MAKSEIKIRIKQINSSLEYMLQEDRRIKSSHYDQWIKDLLLDMNENGVSRWPWAKLIDCAYRKASLREKKQLEDSIYPRPKPVAGTIGIVEIMRAKEVPIDQILQFNRQGQALCLWHDDKNPSLKWFKKNNKVKCFSCGQVGDSVDVVMKLYNLNLPQAVKRLLNM